jgi:hypothetical protein
MGMPGPVSRSSFEKYPSRSIFSRISSSKIEETYNSPKYKGNPDPANYKIINHKQINEYLIVQLNYPNCTNFEGEKILVFKDVTFEQLKKQKLIDPHFSNNENYFHPIARFIPTEDGWHMAEKLCGECPKCKQKIEYVKRELNNFVWH